MSVRVYRLRSASWILLVFVFFLSGEISAGTLDSPVTLRVRDTSGELLPGSYVAIVPVWRPWSRPGAETITERGVATFRVAAGTYRFIVGAPGYEVTTYGPLAVSPAPATDFDVELRPVKRISGTVSDEQGNPLSGIRVSDVRAVIPPPLGTLSELAVRHLAGTWSVKTDEDGSWALPVAGDGNVPVVIDGPGFVTAWRLFSVKNPQTDLILTKGGTLRLIADRTDPNLVIGLTRDGDDAAGTIPPDWQPQVWSKWASVTTLTWDSLPAGNYTIRAKYPDARYFMAKAATLATARVTSEAPVEVRVTLPPQRSLAEDVHALFLAGISRRDLGEAEAFAGGADGRARRVDSFLEDVSGGSVLYVRGEGKRPPFYALTATRFIAANPDVADARDDAATEPWVASVHARSDVRLRLRSAEKDLTFPGSGTAVLRDCPRSKRISVPVEIGKENVVRFVAPAGCRMLTIALDPFEPLVLEKRLNAGEQSLGEFVLRAAATADVHVVRDPGGASVAGATVRLMAASDERPDTISVLVAEATAGDDGWAHFSGAPVYRDLQVVAETPQSEKSVAAELRLQPRQHGVIDPLAVPKPATLIVEPKIDAAFHTRFPAARVVNVLVKPNDPRRSNEKRQENLVSGKRQENTGDEDSLRFDGLYPGLWRVSCIVRVAGTYSVFESEEIELKAGDSRRFPMRIEPLVFEGRVTESGKGIAARIAVVDPAAIASRLYFDSAGNGEFHAVLPTKGVYAVEVAALASQGDIIPIGDVDFTDPAKPIEIAIPRGSVIARVRDDGKPVPEAVVAATLLRDARGRVQTMETMRVADAFGEATFEGLIPGLWTFSVRQRGQGRGAKKSRTVQANEELEVDLDLDRAIAIEGTVLDMGGMPLPRARVDCVFVSNAGIPNTAGADADAEGKFTVEVDSLSAPPALCSVIGPMGAVDAFRATPGQHVNIAVPAATAALHIPDWGAHRNPNVFWLAAPDGRVISLSAVAVEIGRFGAPLEIPALATGRWNVVRIQSLSQWFALGNGLAASLPTVADVAMDSGSSKVIHLYGSSAP